MRTTSWFIRSRWLAIMKEKLNGDEIWRFIKHKGDSWLRSYSHVRDNSDCFWKNTKSGVFRKKLKRMYVCVYSHAMVTTSILVRALTSNFLFISELNCWHRLLSFAATSGVSRHSLMSASPSNSASHLPELVCEEDITWVTPVPARTSVTTNKWEKKQGA